MNKKNGCFSIEIDDGQECHLKFGLNTLIKFAEEEGFAPEEAEKATQKLKSFHGFRVLTKVAYNEGVRKGWNAEKIDIDEATDLLDNMTQGQMEEMVNTMFDSRFMQSASESQNKSGKSTKKKGTGSRKS